MSTTIDDNEPRVEHTWPLVTLDRDGRPMWHRMGSNPPVYEYQPRLEALWRRAQRWAQAELWEVTA
jgi:hypothetical protein